MEGVLASLNAVAYVGDTNYSGVFPLFTSNSQRDMANKSTTLQALRAELESVDAAIEKYTRVRKALVEVITFLGNEELQELLSTPDQEEAEEESKDGKETGLPTLPQDGIEAVRKALAARNQG